MRTERKKQPAEKQQCRFRRYLNFKQPFHRITADVRVSLTEEGDEFGEIIIKAVSGFDESETMTISFDSYPMLKKALERIEQYVFFSAQ